MTKMVSRQITFQKAKQRLDEKDSFREKHPDCAGYIGPLINTVLSCLSEPKFGRPVRLESAYEHIFGKAGQAGCKRCSSNFKDACDLIDRALRCS